MLVLGHSLLPLEATLQAFGMCRTIWTLTCSVQRVPIPLCPSHCLIHPKRFALWTEFVSLSNERTTHDGTARVSRTFFMSYQALRKRVAPSWPSRIGMQCQLDGRAESSKSVRRNDGRRGADHYDDGLKPNRHTLPCSIAHPDTSLKSRLKTGKASIDKYRRDVQKLESFAARTSRR